LNSAGAAAAFRPGNTWFEVIDPNSLTRFEDGRFYARSRVPGIGQ
jgi:hypothetical protein